MAIKSHGRTGRPWRRLRAAVLDHSDVCWLCGLPGADTVDHILPLSQHPELAHDRSNLAPAHGRCTSRKGRRTDINLVRPTRQW
jgi:5-methylcytosine-specific restriction endonuclease McrA